MIYKLPELEYAYDALEPFIDERTMQIHHRKHHQAYVDNLNRVLEKYPGLGETSLEDLMRNLDSLSIEEKDKIALKNHGGGHLNHTLFWKIMGPKKQIDHQLQKDVEKEFGSVERFKELFTKTANSHFGSGWAWLVRDERGKLLVYSTANQNSPFLRNHTPVICLDVWEHAYYLKYQNRRAEYVENWWNVLKLL